jgi:hypothetical protein
MSAQTEFVGKAFDQMFENFRKASETTLQMQQDFFRQCLSAWPGAEKAAQPAWTERVQQFHKQWSQMAADFTRKSHEAWEKQYQAGLRTLEEAFKLGEIKEPAELRRKTEELWRKSFDCLKEFGQAQLREFQTVLARWMEMTTKGGGA